MSARREALPVFKQVLRFSKRFLKHVTTVCDCEYLGLLLLINTILKSLLQILLKKTRQGFKFIFIPNEFQNTLYEMKIHL